jgi:hypothetical protein
MYGSLGGLPGLSVEGRAYGEKGIPAILSSANSIHLVRSGSPPASFDQAKKMMQWAERIVILGFGFDRINCERLGIMDFARLRDGLAERNIEATLFKVCPVDEKRIKAIHLGLEESDEHAEVRYAEEGETGWIEWFDGDALSYMENHGIEPPQIQE